jgi:YfiH family protein
MSSDILESSDAAVFAFQAGRFAGVSHSFLGRIGGVSRGVFSEFNLAGWVGDEPAAVAENWRRWRNKFPSMRPACLNQVHGNAIHVVDGAFGFSRPAGDGLVTANLGVALCIFTADCVPVLLVDPLNRVAGALHAGWRGALADISVAGVCAMLALGARAESIEATLGPAIGPCCFEVDEELCERFEREVSGVKQHARPGRPGKAFLGLRGILRDQLERAGLYPRHISNVGPCTKCASDRFFSRRANGGVVGGLQMSFVGFTP